jgi:hypothetical protein
MPVHKTRSRVHRCIIETAGRSTDPRLAPRVPDEARLMGVIREPYGLGVDRLSARVAEMFASLPWSERRCF